MMNDRRKYDFTELVLLLMQGDINPRQIAQLELLLKTEPEAVRRYIELMEINTELALHTDAASAGEFEETGHYDAFLHSLAREENTAPSVSIPHPPERIPDPVQRTSVRSENWRFNKNSLFTIIVSAAAMILVVIFARYAPVNVGTEVATLTQSMNAQWDAGDWLNDGVRLTDRSGPIGLETGFVEVLFDNNAKLVIEGPAKFQLLSRDLVELAYGKIYAVIPQEAIGFSVNTQTGKIIDLGTEFGVDAAIDGAMELHVLKGKTLLVAGIPSQKLSREVYAGDAKRVSAISGSVTDVPIQKELFAREIDAQTNAVWYGQDTIDLAGIVGGGDGFGSPHKMARIDLLTGRFTEEHAEPEEFANPGFQRVDASPFIDGVFIPGPGSEPIISSTGLRFGQYPETCDGFYYHISNSSTILEPTSGREYPTSLRDVGSVSGSILLHANAGITFDLQTMREHFQGFKMAAFSADYGISRVTVEAMKLSGGDMQSADGPSIDFYVVIDGKLRHHAVIDQHFEPANVRVPLTVQDRFLSLIATDHDLKTYFDWFVLENARIHLERQSARQQ